MTKTALIGVIENEESQQKLITSLLSDENKYHITFYESGMDFLNSKVIDELDLIYIDLHLPDMSGLEIVKITKTNYPAAKIVIQSSLPDEESFFNAIISGAIGYHWKAETEDFKLKNRIFLDGGSILTPTIAFRISSFIKKYNCQGLGEIPKQILNSMTKGSSIDMIHENAKIQYSDIYKEIRNIYKTLTDCDS